MANLLDGNIALVTGAGSGIGRAIARGFAGEGATVVAVDIDEAGAAETARMIGDAGGAAHSHALDVTDRGACVALAATVAADVGEVSILVNNAGIVRRTTIDKDGAPDDWDAILSVNVDGPFNVTRAFLDALTARKGRVINIGSVQSMIHAATSIAYTVSKGAIMNFTKGLATELGPQGVRVNTIGPGLIRTPLNADVRASPDHEDNFLRRTPLRRVGDPEDIVGPAIFLASEMSGYVSGVYMPVDGGLLAN